MSDFRRKVRLIAGVAFASATLATTVVATRADAAILLPPAPIVTLDSQQPTASTERAITVTPSSDLLANWPGWNTDYYDLGFSAISTAFTPSDTNVQIVSVDPPSSPGGSPQHIVIDVSDHDPNINLYLMARAQFLTQGIGSDWSTPVLIYGPGSTPPPVDDGKQHGIVTNVSWSVSNTTALWNLDVTVGLSNVTCPATLVVSINAWVKRSQICAIGETASTELHFPWKVFNTDHSLPPGSNVAIQAFIGKSKEPAWSGQGLVPAAPLAISVGDSYNSGHHQLVDSPFCAAESPIPCIPADYNPNDPYFSWVFQLTNKLNVNVPAEWQYAYEMRAQSGATTQEMRDQFQAGAMSYLLALHPGSWNLLAISGGANNGNLAGVLSDYYTRHNVTARPIAPWAVKSWGDCPDTQAMYQRLIGQEAEIRSDLSQLVTSGRNASTSVRIIDVLYPYIMKSDNVCNVDREIPIDPDNPAVTQTWHGAKSVVDLVDSFHDGITGPDVFKLDLRTTFTTNPLSKLQLVRVYGYPHVNSDGQAQMATRMARLLR